MMSWRHGPLSLSALGPWSVAVTVGPPRASVHSEHTRPGPLLQSPSDTPAPASSSWQLHIVSSDSTQCS